MTITSAPVTLTATAKPARLADGRHTTYSQILSSTAVVGGASAANVFFSAIRAKAVALLLGPSGTGLLGTYVSIADVALSLAGMGIQTSGVRQIAEAAGSRDIAAIARTAAVLRRVAIALGLLGAVILALLALPVARLTFGSDRSATAVAVLSLVVLFREIAAGQGALIQGTRRISDFARLNVLSGLFATVVTIPIIYVWRTGGIVPSLVAVAALSIVTSSWYARKIRLPRVDVTMRQMAHETNALLGLGFAFMVMTFLSMAAGYITRVIVLRVAGLEAAGHYQAAWALGGLYVGFILQAMGTDFYPRLTAVAQDDVACNRLVNEQAEISLLLAGPGVIATLTFAPLVVALFYSARFSPAVPLLRWICLGMTLRVIAWPMGYVLFAKGMRGMIVATEAAATAVQVGMTWVLLPRIGVAGAGVAFFGLYVWHTALMYLIVRRLTGFRWSLENVRLAALFLPLIAVLFCAFYVVSSWLTLALGLTLTCVCALHSSRAILRIVAATPNSRLIRLLPPWFRLSGAEPR